VVRIAVAVCSLPHPADARHAPNVRSAWRFPSATARSPVRVPGCAGGRPAVSDPRDRGIGLTLRDRPWAWV